MEYYKWLNCFVPIVINSLKTIYNVKHTDMQCVYAAGYSNAGILLNIKNND